MKKTNISLKDAELFYSMCLDNSKGIYLSNFTEEGKKLIEELIKDERQIFEKKKVKRNSKKVYLKSPSKFLAYLDVYFGIHNLEEYINVLKNKNIDRDEIASKGFSTKLIKTSPKEGIYINAPSQVIIKINNTDINVCLPSGTALFIRSNASIEIPDDVIIVGVENFTNIIKAPNQKKLFEKYGKVVFMERGKMLKKILRKSNNKYIHYGDIDLAGVDIYQNEYYPIVKERGDFFLPCDDIEELFKKYRGIPDLYNNQIERYKNIKGINEKMEKIISAIHKYKVGIEQEVFISSELE